MTIEVFTLFCAGLLLVCALYSWYMVDKLYTEAVCLYASQIELAEQLSEWLEHQNRRGNEPDNERRPDSGEST